jgi:hypothetical protein
VEDLNLVDLPALSELIVGWSVEEITTFVGMCIEVILEVESNEFLTELLAQRYQSLFPRDEMYAAKLETSVSQL